MGIISKSRVTKTLAVAIGLSMIVSGFAPKGVKAEEELEKPYTQENNIDSNEQLKTETESQNEEVQGDSLKEKDEVDSQNKIEEGFIQKDGKTYYINADGSKARGIKEIGGKKYYFRWNSYDLYKDGWLYFWRDGKWVYTDKNTGAFVVGEKELPEETDQNGKKIPAGIYTFDSDGFKTGYKNPELKEGWSKDGQYFVENGKKVRGIKDIDGKRYYFGWNDNKLYKNGWLYFWTDKNSVYTDKNTGAFVVGEKELPEEKDQDGNTYSAGIYTFDDNGFKIKYRDPELEEGWSKDGQYFVENGKKVRGIKEIDGKRYYFGWNDNKLYKNGWLYFWTDKNSVYTDKNTGAFVVGEKELPEEKDQDGNTYSAGIYTFDDNGFKIKYRDPNLKEGWSKDGQYYVENGKKVRGIKEIDGKRYYFGWNDNKLYKNGWLYFWTDKNSVYTDKNTGAFVVGEKKLSKEKDQNGNTYNAGIYTFDDNGFKIKYRDPNLKEGWSKDGQYFVENGQKVRGLKIINGKRYYFEWNSYKLYKKGWLHFWQSDEWVYTDRRTGEFYTGQRYIEDSGNYYFDNNGVRCRGIQTVNGKRYYYDWKNYKLFRSGWLYINPAKSWVYANGQDGSFATGWVKLNNKSYHFDQNGYKIGGADVPVWHSYMGHHTSPTNYFIAVDRQNCRTRILKRNRSGEWYVQNNWLCTPGKASTPTPSGIYSITVEHRGTHFGEDKGYSAYWFANFGRHGKSYGCGFHSTICFPWTYIEAPKNQLGKRLSHGCVRLSLQNAKWLYFNIPFGTTVRIY